MISINDYLPRIADKVLTDKLQAFGATLISGPKWCGKTTTASMQAKSILKMDDVDNKQKYLLTAQMKPSSLLKGEKPRLIDEWQIAPELWDAVRNDVDDQNEDGLYILTGSNSIKSDKITHTGIGRISRMKMYPMSLYESKESNGSISISELFSNTNIDINTVESTLSLDELIFAACRGGWPSSLNKKTDYYKLLVAQDYVNGIYQTEISSIDSIQRDPIRTQRLLYSYARNLSTVAKRSTILADINSQSSVMSDNTLVDYLVTLEKLFVLEDVPAWCPQIRSASAIRSSNKLEFVDPSIAVASLGVTPEYFDTDFITFGFVFECLCARDLRVYSQNLGGTLSYYRDRYGLEADFVLHLKDGRYALIACKLGYNNIDDGANHLLKIKSLIKQYNEKEKQCPLREPDLLIVLTATNLAYKREDGVFVIPIGCLKD